MSPLGLQWGGIKYGWTDTRIVVLFVAIHSIMCLFLVRFVLVDYGSPLLNTTWACTCNNAWLPSVDYTRTWTPTLVMDLNMGFFRNVVIRVPPGQIGNVSQTTGIASLPLNEFPEITNPGISQLGSSTNTNQVNITNTFTPFGTITKTFGAHTFKFGASLRKNQFNTYNPAASPEGALLSMAPLPIMARPESKHANRRSAARANQDRPIRAAPAPYRPSQLQLRHFLPGRLESYARSLPESRHPLGV